MPATFPSLGDAWPESAPSGDMHLAVTTLSSASGANDRTSLRRGVAGLDLPHSRDDLDAA